MRQPSLPPYQELDQALSKTAAKPHASQVHGLVCGLLCGNKAHSYAFAPLVVGNEKITKKTELILKKLHQVSEKQLETLFFDLQLVLPGDDLPLSTRAEALTVWCQGFITGLKLSDVPLDGRKASETTEAINDLIEIAKMKYEMVSGKSENEKALEEDECAYTELVEYVRIAVILIYQDLQEATTSKKSLPPSKHLH